MPGPGADRIMINIFFFVLGVLFNMNSRTKATFFVGFGIQLIHHPVGLPAWIEKKSRETARIDKLEGPNYAAMRAEYAERRERSSERKGSAGGGGVSERGRGEPAMSQRERREWEEREVA